MEGPFILSEISVKSRLLSLNFLGIPVSPHILTRAYFCFQRKYYNHEKILLTQKHLILSLFSLYNF